MVLQGPNYWDIAGDCMQIVLCLLILVFFIRNRVQKKSQVFKRTKNPGGRSFNEQVLTQTVQQQIDQAFNNIMDTLNTERENLESILGINPKRGENIGISKMQPISQMSKIAIRHQKTNETAGSDQRREKVVKLSAKGLDARQISGELKIPISEVELILSLQKN